MQREYRVLLKMDKREFKGEGATRQQAKHNAAQKALKILRNTPQLPPPSPSPQQAKVAPKSDVPSNTVATPSQPSATGSGTSLSIFNKVFQLSVVF